MTHRFKLSPLALAACVFLNLMAGNAAAQTAKPAAAKKPAAAARPAATAPVASATLRIACDGQNAKAEISINGALKGECPFDTDVPAGTVTVKATKSVNNVWEQVYEEEFRLGPDIAKRVEIVLKARQFRADAVARMDVEVEALLGAKEAQQRSELPALEKAAEAGDAAAMRRLATVHKFGLAGPVDFKKAVYWYERGVQAKDAASMYELAMLHFRGRADRRMSNAESIELVRESAVAGNPDAMCELALELQYGTYGLQKNIAAAADYFEKAAEAGVKNAAAGWRVSENELKRKNPDSVKRKIEQLEKTAREVARKKADSFEDFDATAAASILGFESVKLTDEEYETGLRYSRMTMRYFKKAAATGIASELVTLATTYQLGRLTPKDLQTAANLMRQARR